MEPLTLKEMTDVLRTSKLEASPIKIRNWTLGRPLEIGPSYYDGGQGSLNLYSIQDLCLMALAIEFNNAGFGFDAIKLLLELAKPLVLDSGREDVYWTIWRTKPGGAFRIAVGDDLPDKHTRLFSVMQVGPLLHNVVINASNVIQRRVKSDSRS